VVSLALIFIMGCTSPKFRSKRDESYDGKLERALIVYYDENTRATLGRDFSRRLVNRLGDLLDKQNVPCESVLLNNSALNRSAPLKAAAERFQPSQLLYFSITRASTSSSTYLMDANDLPHFSHSMVVTLEFDVFDSKTDKTVWRTAVDYYTAPRPEDVAEQVIEQLRVAKLL